MSFISNIMTAQKCAAVLYTSKIIALASSLFNCLNKNSNSKGSAFCAFTPHSMESWRKHLPCFAFLKLDEYTLTERKAKDELKSLERIFSETQKIWIKKIYLSY